MEASMRQRVYAGRGRSAKVVLRCVACVPCISVGPRLS